jgi:hypothetical protein
MNKKLTQRQQSKKNSKMTKSYSSLMEGLVVHTSSITKVRSYKILILSTRALKSIPNLLLMLLIQT